MNDHQRQQCRHEIAWIEKEIVKLAKKIIKKPRVQRQIDTYRKQIRQKEYQIDLGL